MKFVIMIHSNPQPWGHPTSDFLPAYQDLPAEQKQQMNAEFEVLLDKLSAAGELVGGAALADPLSATLYRWRDGKAAATDGPYSETKEHFAGYFVIDVESKERAQEIAAQFSGPGETVELRPAM